MLKILCSTGAMNRKGMAADAYKLAELYPLTGADGYELLIQSGWTAENMEQCTVLSDAGINIPLVHLAKRIGTSFSAGSKEGIKSGLELLKTNCELARRLGVNKAVLHLWGYPDSNFDYIIKGYVQALDICREYGIEALAETLPTWERPITEWLRYLAEINPGCRFTIDSRHLCWNGMEKAIFSEDWLWRENRIAHVHISDCAEDIDGRPTREPLHPGEGMIDIDSFIGSLLQKGYEGLITLESPADFAENGGIDITKVARSIKLLKGMVKL